MIDQIIEIARSGRAAIAAIPLGDTLKEAERTDRGIIVRKTIPRDELWRAQTPQGFPRALITQAHADGAGLDATDDAQLVERLGLPGLGKRRVCTPLTARIVIWSCAQDHRTRASD